MINTEWGALGNTGSLDFVRTRWDHAVDAGSKNFGKQVDCDGYNVCNKDIGVNVDISFMNDIWCHLYPGHLTCQEMLG